MILITRLGSNTEIFINRDCANLLRIAYINLIATGIVFNMTYRRLAAILAW